MKHLLPSSAVVLVLLLAACGPAGGPDVVPAAVEPPPLPSNRTAIPPVVRRNLGITFAKATYRPVAETISLPGHFEVIAAAQQHYPAPVAGRVTVHVVPLQRVEAGQLLLELDAPAWRQLQRRLGDHHAERLRATAELDRRRASLEAAGGLAGADEGLEVYRAELRAAEAELQATDQHLAQLLAEAATLSGLPVVDLQAFSDGEPGWRRLERIPIRAVDAGVVREVDAASGTWIGEGAEVVHVLRPEALRFRAKALQADLIDSLRDGQKARIVVPEGAGPERRGEPVAGLVRLGVTGDPDTRTVDVFIDLDAAAQRAWIRPQVAALAEVAVAGDPDGEELAIPVRAVIRDGLESVFFRRDPADPEVVIRTTADLGPSDGRWVTVYSGLAEGDEVVVDGVYQLKLATTGRKVQAGHFHADGTWHEGDH